MNIDKIKEFVNELRKLDSANEDVQQNINAAIVHLDLAVRASQQSFAPDAARVAPHCVHGYNGTFPECGAMQTPPRR